MSFRLLLIEDDPISQEVIRSLLAGQGHAVEVASDGFGALEKLGVTRFDAALVDYHLPEMDGFALGRLILAERRSQGAPPVLIGLTADRNGLAARRGSDAVFRAILPKPVDPAELFATLARLLGEARSMAGVAAPSAPAVSTALWSRFGLSRAPRAFVAPEPLPDQVSALSLCFDLVPAAEAEMVLLMERHGMKQALHSARSAPGAPWPIVGISADIADVCDTVFKVSDIDSWSWLAGRLGASQEVPTAVAVLSEGGSNSAEVCRPAGRDEQSRPAAPGRASSLDLPQAEFRARSTGNASLPIPAADAPSSGRDEPAGAENLRAARRALNVLTACLSDDREAEPAASARDAMLMEPRRLVATLVEQARASTRVRGLSIGLHVDTRLPDHVNGDAALFGELVSVMLDEAIRRWEEGEISLHLDVSPRVDRISVRLATVGNRPRGGVSEVFQQLSRTRAALFRHSVEIGGGELPAGMSEGELPSEFTLPVRCDARLEPSATSSTSASEPCAIDQTKRGALMDNIGAATVERLSRHLLADVERAAAIDGSDRWWRLTELSSCAAMLGFDELAAICARPQAASPKAPEGTVPHEIEQALKRVQAAFVGASAAA